MTIRSDFQSCCYTAALDTEVAFCPDCGTSLYRCPGFKHCHNLVKPLGYCTVCIQAQLALAPQAITQARVGEVLSLPFLLRNTSPAGQPLVLMNILTQQRGHPLQTVPLGWNSLDAGQERMFSVDTEDLTSGGMHRLQLFLVLGSLEEQYVFAAEVVFEVDSGPASQIVQNIHFQDTSFGTGGMVVANPNAPADPARKARSLGERQEVALERVERFELEQGYRGYAGQAVRIPRDVRFEYFGFPAADTPPPGPLPGTAPSLRCGRNSRRHDAQHNPHPNDLCLRAYDPQTGRLDAAGSKTISRQIGTFLLRNDRLYLQAATTLQRNDERLDSGALYPVFDGDSFMLAGGTAHTFTVALHFQTRLGEVALICFERTPPVPTTAPDQPGSTP